MVDFGPEYHKIQSAFKRTDRGIIIPGEWTTNEFEFLADTRWRWTEKVDGTNIRLHWDGSEVTIGGRTNNAQIPMHLVKALETYLNPEPWREAFYDSDDVTIYGEGYGAKIQKGGGNYRPDQGFIMFDVLVGQYFLRPYDQIDISARLGIDMVPFVGYGSPTDTWELIKADALASAWPDVTTEGVVGTPMVPLFDRRGKRIVMKMKLKDWADYQRRM